jgi:RNA recognition motif-containing protein
MNIYIGNLSGEVTDHELLEAFKEFGEVKSVNIIRDKFSGLSREYGFVEMPVKAEAEAAVSSLNGTELKGKKLTVIEARPRSEFGTHGGRRFR